MLCSTDHLILLIRLISIESQPKKVVVVVVVVAAGLAVVVGLVVVIVGHRNSTLKVGQNWVNNKSYIVVVVKTWSKSGHYHAIFSFF